MNITILTLYDRISLFHSLHPFFYFENQTSHRFTLTDSPEFCLNKDRNTILIMDRMFLKPDWVDIQLLEKLRSNYRRIAFFNGNAGGGIHRPEVLPFVDLFYSKSLFADPKDYQKDLYGGELYSDYYHQEFGVLDSQPKIVPAIASAEDQAKLRLSWNVGIGEFPRHKYRQRFGVATARIFGAKAARLFMRKNHPSVPKNTGEYPINARIGYQTRESIAFQRRLHMEKIETTQGVLVGKVPQAQFNREIHNSKIIYSPFGWGELCFRDFEAVLSGALLVKPDMAHLKSWPDIFVPGETYVPVRWDGEDLVETLQYYLSNHNERQRIVQNAYEAYIKQEADMPHRFKSILEEIVDGV